MIKRQIIINTVTKKNTESAKNLFKNVNLTDEISQMIPNCRILREIMKTKSGTINLSNHIYLIYLSFFSNKGQMYFTFNSLLSVI